MKFSHFLCSGLLTCVTGSCSPPSVALACTEQSSKKDVMLLTKIQNFVCTNICQGFLQAVLLNKRVMVISGSSLQSLCKGTAYLLWKWRSHLPQCTIITLLADVTHQDSPFVSDLVLWNNMLQANHYWKGSACFTVNDFDALGRSCTDLPLSCLDWQDPFYKSVQLSSPIAAAKEI